MISSVIQIEKFVSDDAGFSDELLDHHTRAFSG